MVDALKLLKEAPWSSLPVEQQHGPMAVVHRLHGEMGMNVLSLRSFVHATRALCRPQETPLHTRHALHNIAKLAAHRHGQCRGFHAYAKEVHARARAQKGETLTFQECQDATTRAHVEYKKLTDNVKDKYQQLAVRDAEQKRHMVQSELAEQRQFIELAMKREEEETAAVAVKHRLSMCRFTDSEWAGMADYWNGVLQSKPQDQVIRECERDAAPVPQPSVALIAQLNDAKPDKPPVERKSDLVRFLAKHRGIFQGLVFMEEVPDADKGFMMSYATQTPLRVYFVPDTPSAPVIPDVPLGSPLHKVADIIKGVGRFEWTWRIGEFCTYEVFTVDDFNKLWVFQDIQFKGADRVLTHICPSPLQMFANRFRVASARLSNRATKDIPILDCCLQKKVEAMIKV